MGIDLKNIQREWIEGISEANFSARVDSVLRRLVSVPEAATRGCGVAIAEKDPVDFAAAFFATAALGLPVILVNPRWGEREWGEFGELFSPAVWFGLEKPPVESKATARDPLRENTVLIPTGGSTAGVRYVVHDADSLAAASNGVGDFLGGGPIDSCCVLPLYHVSGLMQLLRAYHSGGRVRFDEDLIEGRYLSYVPTQLQRALDDSERLVRLRTARAIFVGGAAMSADLVIRVRALGLPVMPVYGMTETAAMVGAVPSRDFLADSRCGALPIGGACFSIEVDGRIRIQSPALFSGYYGQAPIDRTAGYLSGDAGWLDDEGRLHVLGRVDRLINSGGEKIDPHEVESALARLDGVDEVLAVGIPDRQWGQKLVAFYTGTELVGWRDGLASKLAHHKLPKHLVRVSQLPLDEKGKLCASTVERLIAEDQRRQG